MHGQHMVLVCNKKSEPKTQNNAKGTNNDTQNKMEVKKKIREGSLGYPGVATPVFTKDSKPPGKRKDPWAPRDWDTRTHLKK
ncbi:hypothetical protein AVEN_109191-1, partial [Araneus ventricosus]